MSSSSSSSSSSNIDSSSVRTSTDLSNFNVEVPSLSDLNLKFDPFVLSEAKNLIALRRKLHTIPELGFQEFKTQAFIVDFLKQLQINHRQVAKTGVVANISSSGRTAIAFRADMDGLPILEENKIDYCSSHPHIMHACGHDGHMAILLSFVRLIQKTQKQLKKDVCFIFQPAEEGDGGARDIIAEGVLDNPPVENIFGLHLWSQLPVGTISVVYGPMMAQAEEFQIEIIGESAHGATPHLGVDAIYLTSLFIQQISGIIARRLDPFKEGVISVGKINGGEKSNIIAQSVKIEGIIRALDNDTFNSLKQELIGLLENLCSIYGAKYKTFFKLGYPALVNHPTPTQFVEKCAKEFLGKENIYAKKTMGAEDFAFYNLKIPGSYFFIGSGNEKQGIIHPQHHPKYQMDERSLLIGLEMFWRLAKNLLF